MSGEPTKKNFYVIGAGLGRTGTSSFQKALEILGLGPAYHMKEVFKNKHYQQWITLGEDPEDKETLNAVLLGAGHHSSCDFPSAVFWEQQLSIYPDAKVVLTARDPEKWYKSCTDTIFQMMPNHPLTPFGIVLGNWLGLSPSIMNRMFTKIVFENTFNGDWSKDNVIKCYNKHNRNVLVNCPPEKLLVFDVTQGWAPLCEFLEVPIPSVPFPHVNDTKQFQSFVWLRSMTGYVALSGALLSLPALMALASKFIYGTFIPPQLLIKE